MTFPFPPSYSRFDDDAREFIITRPDTPRPWTNRLWNDLLTVQLDNHGSAKVFERDHGERFYAYNDSGARAVYVLDCETGMLWSPGWLPVREELDFYETRHGINYTVISGKKDGIMIKWINTVHGSAASELWRLTVCNHSDRPRRLLLVPFYQVGLSFRDPYFHGSPDLFRAELSNAQDLFFLKNYSRQRDGERYALAYHSSKPVSGFELSKEGFLRHYGSMEHPQTILRDDFRQSLPDRQPPVFAMRYALELRPEESWDVSIHLYSAETFEEARKRVPIVARKGIVSASLMVHREDADRFFGDNNVATGDLMIDRLVNLWTKHQMRYNAFWNREEFGIGMRDAMQDCDSYVLHDPPRVRQRLLEATRHIYEDGHTVRKWARLDLKPYFDGGVWYVNALCKYLRETGEMALLEEREPFFESKEVGSVLDHAKRALDFLDAHRGPNGLCRMGFGDWNDALNGVDREGKGQSVWTSMAFVWALQSFIELLDWIGDDERSRYEGIMKGMVKLLNQTCFEKDRYIRAITDAGEKVGSESCEEGKIYLNPQSWAMICGLASRTRVAKMRKAVRKYLYTEFGPVLLDPVYTMNRPDIGRITSDPPGFVENGANYVHAAMFHAYGLVLAGHPDDALEVVHQVLPSNPTNSSERSGLEPYMVTNAYEGPASIHPGRAMFPWRTGSASWLLKLVWEGFFGLRPGFDGLRVTPAFPRAWKPPIRAERRVRGLRLVFLFATSADASTSDLAIEEGGLIPYAELKEGMTIKVKVNFPSRGAGA